METKIIQKIVFIMWVVPFFVLITKYYNFPTQKHNTSNSTLNPKSIVVKNRHEEFKIKDNFTYGLNFHLSYNTR